MPLKYNIYLTAMKGKSGDDGNYLQHLASWYATRVSARKMESTCHQVSPYSHGTGAGCTPNHEIYTRTFGIIAQYTVGMGDVHTKAWRGSYAMRFAWRIRNTFFMASL